MDTFVTQKSVRLMEVFFFERVALSGNDNNDTRYFYFNKDFFVTYVRWFILILFQSYFELKHSHMGVLFTIHVW